MAARPAELLIFGYGNPSRGDDALGPLLLERLDLRLSGETRRAAGGIALVTDFQLQIEHALDLEGRRLALFVDAHSTCPTAYRLERLAEIADWPYSTHALPPAALLQVYRKITGSPPPPSFSLAIRGFRFELGEGLSPAAAAHLDAATALALDLCRHPTLAYWSMHLAS
ncbi:hydrogenase maturation protease [Candidatus Methylocalor cossyra]|uniref:Ni,Fe-hydrogenase maturation factor HoxW n=1 Tax=Candidatus Methylocalor cossyra TaxID=3108543 RepID=A0ABM9NL33_9GAMM